MPGAKTRLHLLGPLTQDQTHINVGKCLGRLSDRPLAAPQTRFVSCIYYTSLPCTPTNFNISWFVWKKKKCLSNQQLPRQSEVSFLIPYNRHTKHLPFTNIVNITFVVFYQQQKKELRRLQGCSYCVKLKGVLFAQRKMHKYPSLAVISLINNMHFTLAFIIITS